MPITVYILVQRLQNYVPERHRCGARILGFAFPTVVIAVNVQSIRQVVVRWIKTINELPPILGDKYDHPVQMICTIEFLSPNVRLVGLRSNRRLLTCPVDTITKQGLGLLLQNAIS